MTHPADPSGLPPEEPKRNRSLFAAVRDTLLDVATAERDRRRSNPLPSQAFDWLIDISALVGAVIALYVAFAIGANVLLRTIPFTDPLKWAYPTTEFSLLYLTFLAAPIVLRREGHVRMTALTEKLRPKPRLWFYVIGSVIGAAVCGVLAWQTFEKTVEELQSGAVLLTSIEVRRALVTWVIPYGFILLGLQFVRMAVNGVRTRQYRGSAEEAGI